MKLLCEIMAQDVLPSVRAIMSKELISEHKMSQNDVAQLLGVSQPAVSQYMRQLRGSSELVANEKIHNDIKVLCAKAKDKKLSETELVKELDDICRVAALLIIENGKTHSQKEMSEN